nr:hypothetical protein [uncultured archaeon]
MAPKNKVNLEIERRFLLKNVPTFGKKRNFEIFDIFQFYFDVKGKRTRFRRLTDIKNKDTYFSTKKKFISKGTYEEIEIEIPEKTFWKRFRETKNRKGINKTRFVYKYKGLKFEIDRFKNMHLVVMEIELKNINQKINFPDFIKEEIILEVTELRELGNYSLSGKC